MIVPLCAAAVSHLGGIPCGCTSVRPTMMARRPAHGVLEIGRLGLESSLEQYHSQFGSHLRPGDCECARNLNSDRSSNFSTRFTILFSSFILRSARHAGNTTVEDILLVLIKSSYHITTQRRAPCYVTAILTTQEQSLTVPQSNG